MPHTAKHARLFKPYASPYSLLVTFILIGRYNCIPFSRYSDLLGCEMSPNIL